MDCIIIVCREGAANFFTVNLQGARKYPLSGTSFPYSSAFSQFIEIVTVMDCFSVSVAGLVVVVVLGFVVVVVVVVLGFVVVVVEGFVAVAVPGFVVVVVLDFVVVVSGFAVVVAFVV